MLLNDNELSDLLNKLRDIAIKNVKIRWEIKSIVDDNDKLSRDPTLENSNVSRLTRAYLDRMGVIPFHLEVGKRTDLSSFFAFYDVAHSINFNCHISNVYSLAAAVILSQGKKPINYSRINGNDEFVMAVYDISGRIFKLYTLVSEMDSSIPVTDGDSTECILDASELIEDIPEQDFLESVCDLLQLSEEIKNDIIDSWKCKKKIEKATGTSFVNPLYKFENDFGITPYEDKNLWYEWLK